MEAFSLLKFWRNSGADACPDTVISCPGNNSVDVRNRAPEVEDDTDDDDDSFFDLEFTVPNCSDKEEKNAECILGNGSSKCNQAEDASNGFVETTCKAKVFPIDSNSKPQSPISLLKSAPKFRVFLLGFKKSKSDKTQQGNEGLTSTPRYQFQKSSENEQSKRFTVKYKVEDVPVGSLFSRDNSLRSKLERERSFDFSMCDSSKSLPKDVPKYLKLIKPLYIRASKRYTEKIRLSSDQLSSDTPLSSPATAPSCSPRKLSEEKRVNRTAGFRVVSKHLGKSRSASSTAGAMPSPANRRDDSLLLQHDGIQSAILHCKRSYNLSAKDCSALSRSASEPYQGKPINPGSYSYSSQEQQMRCSSI